MQDALKALEDTAERTLATARELALLRGLARKVGFDAANGVPREIMRDVTEDDKPKIVAANRAVSNFVWMQHARDAVCVELDLTPGQVAGVLAHATRKENEAAAAPVVSPTDRTNPANWPPRIHVLNGGKATEPPAKGKAERQADAIDKDAIIAARIQIREGDAWDTFRQAYGAHRRLTTQQIAKVVADRTLAAQTTQPVAQA